MNRIVIWGAAGHARVVADILHLRGEFQMVGFLDDVMPNRKGELVAGLPVLGGKEELENLKRNGATHLIFGFGNGAQRLRLTSLIEGVGFFLATAIHPRAIVAQDVTIGAGTVIVAGAIVNPAATIGRNSIINTAATVDHECVIEEGVHIGPGAHLGGRVHVGKGAWIGIGATILDGITIGAGSIIGAGAVITKNVPENVIAYGVPGRVIRHLDQATPS